jgi:hypothetical protein
MPLGTLARHHLEAFLDAANPAQLTVMDEVRWRSFVTQTYLDGDVVSALELRTILQGRWNRADAAAFSERFWVERQALDRAATETSEDDEEESA